MWSGYRAGVLAALALTTGCATVGTVQTANTLGEGNFQFAAEPMVLGGSVSGASFVYPTLGLAARYGLSDTFDIGGEIGANGISLETKYQFTDPKDEALVCSIAPEIGGFFAAGAGAGAGFGILQLPVLIGIGTSSGNQLILGPKVNVGFFGAVASDSATENVDASGAAGGLTLSAGSTVGYSLRVGDAFRLLPEVGFQYPFFAAAGGTANGTSESGSSTLSGALTYQATLGLLFGKSR